MLGHDLLFSMDTAYIFRIHFCQSEYNLAFNKCSMSASLPFELFDSLPPCGQPLAAFCRQLLEASLS